MNEHHTQLSRPIAALHKKYTPTVLGNVTAWLTDACEIPSRAIRYLTGDNADARDKFYQITREQFIKETIAV